MRAHLIQRQVKRTTISNIDWTLLPEVNNLCVSGFQSALKARAHMGTVKLTQLVNPPPVALYNAQILPYKAGH